MPEQATNEDKRLTIRNDLAVAIVTLEEIATSSDYPEEQRRFAQVALTRLLQAVSVLDQLGERRV